jgi:UDP-3-O-[3-hydroxymyristoyl] N-acetylglucosamine deacetylase
VVKVVNPPLKQLTRKQYTLKEPTSFSGIGIHTGKIVNLRFCPAKEGTGIIFKRMDLAGHPIIPARLEYVQDTSRSTTIGIKEIRIHTVEHVLAAIKACQIDNVCIEISNIEPPVGNGSSDVFVEMIEKVGVRAQEANTCIVKIQQPIYWSEGDIHLVALPADEYRISYTLNYSTSHFLHAQFHSTVVTHDNFKREIAPCRTFSLYKEISALIDRGLIKGGSLDNAVVIKDDAIISKGGLFFQDEMARHKILDLIGDLSLIGFDFQAHIMAIRSGHASNFAFAKKLLNHITENKE